MKKRIINILIWLGLFAYIIVSLNFVAKRSGEEKCEKVNITMTDTLSKLVNKRDIELLMERNKLSAYGTLMKTINKYKLSKLITDSIPLVHKVSIYNAIGGILCINVEQRVPVLRVITNNQQSFYIDLDGYIFPLSKHYGCRALVANGHIFEKGYKDKAIHIDSLKNENNANPRKLKELYTLACYIWNDDLLRSMIEQIYVNTNEYEMIPRLGSQVIYFGNIDNYEKKFFNLKTIYYKVFTNLGWQKYRTINLKYDNQVICIKR